MNGRNPSTWGTAGLLAVMCAGLAWGLSVLYDSPIRPRAVDVPATVAADGQIEPIPAEPSFVMRPIEDFGETVERPLFSSTRSPPADAPVEVAAPEPENTDLDFILQGVVITTDQRVALIRPQSGGDVIRLQEGGKIRGWDIVAILPDQVTLRRNGNETALKIKYDAPAVAPKPKRPKRADRRRRRQRQRAQRN